MIDIDAHGFGNGGDYQKVLDMLVRGGKPDCILCEHILAACMASISIAQNNMEWHKEDNYTWQAKKPSLHLSNKDMALLPTLI